MSKDSNDHSYPLMRGNPVAILLSAWIWLSAMVVLLGWGFSFLGILRWVWIPDAMSLIAIISWVKLAWKNVSATECKALCDLLLFRPLLLLLALIAAAILLYPPETYDSLSYRLPRILLWLQEGSITHLPVSDERINLMPHVWELMTLPLMSVSGEAFLEIPSLVAWVVGLLILWDFARRLGVDPLRAAWMAAIPASAFGFVLQAAGTSNDLLATAFILCSAWFAVSFHGAGASGRQCVLLSGVALALAAGTKPHFIVLVLPWLIWFLAAPGRPWRMLGIIDPLWAIPIGLLCSPLPAFILNHRHYGNYTGPTTSLEGSHQPLVNMAAGTAMMVWQQLQLPINPIVSRWNDLQEAWIVSTHWRDKVPKLGFGMGEIPLVDNASMGAAVFAVLMVGLILAIKRRHNIPSWCWWLAGAGLIGFSLASSKIVPASIGRSYLGFMALGIPVALAGLRDVPIRAVQLATWSCVICSAVVLILTPTHPLWPTNYVRRTAESNPSLASLARNIQKYQSFGEKHEAGGTLVSQIKNDGALGIGVGVGILAGAGEPLVKLIRGHHGKTILYSPGTDLASIEASGVEWLMVTGLAPEVHSTTIQALHGSKRWKMISAAEYQTELRRGYKTWFLYQRTPVRSQ